MRNWQTLVKLALSVVAAVVTYIVANRIINAITDKVEEMSSGQTYEETEPLEDRIIDPAEIKREKDPGDNGQDQEVTEKVKQK